MNKSNFIKLCRAGFKSSAATWRRGEDREAVLLAALPDVPGVYVFVVQDMIMYVGSAKESLRKRIRNYLRRQRQKKEKVRPVHPELAEALKGDGEIEVYVLEPNPLEPLEWKNLPFDLLLGLEAGLIKEFHPAWNRRGRSPSHKPIPLIP